MKRGLFALAAMAILTTMTAGMSYAVDYDHESARRRWEAAQREADQAQQHLNSENSRLATAQRQLDNALNQERTLTDRLVNTRAAIRRTDDQIATKQSSRRQLLEERERLQNQIANLTSEIQSFDQAIVALGNEIRAFEPEINRLTREINRLEGIDPNHPELPRLRRELENTQREQTRLVNEQRRMQDQRNTRLNTRQNHYDRVTNINSNVSTLDREIESLHYDRRQLVANEQDIDLELGRARNIVAEARSQRDRVQMDVDRAASAYQYANGRALEARRYYDEVLANYNNAMNAAVALGTGNARRDTNREAEERSLTAATTDGRASAQARGTEVGTAEARVISEVQGYNHGLTQGASDAALRASYTTGVQTGKGVAQNKAQAENFPRGYNSEMNERLARSPSAATTIDITDSISDQPGDQGSVLLDPVAKPIGSVREPAYSQKSEPPFSAPTPGTVSPTIPSPDHRYYRVECGSQPLPVFDQACRSAYDRTYNGDFAALYRDAYGRTFRSVFTNSVTAPYTAARQVRFNDLYTNAANLGARDKGTLDGYAGEISSARVAAEQNGRRAFTTYLGTGFLPILRSVNIDEDYVDDNLSPGERFKIRIVIDNYGLKSTPLRKLRLNIKALTGGGVNVTFRELPSLASDTTTTLVGVLQGVAGANAAPLNLDAELQLDQGNGTFLTLDEARFSRGIRLPLDLTAIDFPSALPIDTEASANFVFKNNTSREIPATDVALSSLAEVVAVADQRLSLPDIAPGASVTVPVRMTASAMAGGNQLHDFDVDAGGVAGAARLVFKKPVAVPVVRNASMNLCLTSCTAPYQVPLRVRAGGSLVLPAQFTFHSSVRQNGPYEVGKLQVSDSRIGATNGSTLRATLGPWGPTNSPYRTNFGYTFPAALRGQTHWVSLYVKEGARNIHVLKVPVIVE